MAVKLAFNEFPQQVDGNGDPISGGLLFTYVAGSSTKQTTYQDSAGNTPNANPIEFDSSGRPPYPIWLTAGVSYKFVFCPADDTDPPTSPIWTLDNITGINDTSSAQDQWVSGPAPTYVSATSFTLVGDQTDKFGPGRRLKTTNSGGTIYSTIKTSAFTTVTTVTVANDSGTLDAGLSAVSYGLLSATNPSTPLLSDAFPIISGSSDKTKKVRLEVDGLTTDTTRVITMPDTDVNLSGLTGTQAANAIFAGPSSGANALPAFRAQVIADLPAAFTTITARTAFPSANVAVVATSIPQTYSSLLLVIEALSMDTGTRQYFVQVSTDNGSNYDTTAANYQGVFFNNTSGAQNSAATLFLMSALAAANTSTVQIEISGYQAGAFPLAKTAGINISSGVAGQISYVGSTSAVNALRIIMSDTGNFDGGFYTLIGVR